MLSSTANCRPRRDASPKRTRIGTREDIPNETMEERRERSRREWNITEKERPERKRQRTEDRTRLRTEDRKKQRKEDKKPDDIHVSRSVACMERCTDLLAKGKIHCSKVCPACKSNVKNKNNKNSCEGEKPCKAPKGENERTRRIKTNQAAAGVATSVESLGSVAALPKLFNPPPGLPVSREICEDQLTPVQRLARRDGNHILKMEPGNNNLTHFMFQFEKPATTNFMNLNLNTFSKFNI